MTQPDNQPSIDYAERFARIYQAAVTVAGAHDIISALQVIVDSAREAIGAEYAALGIPGDPGQPMARFVLSGVSEQTAAHAGMPPSGRALLGILLQGETLRLDDIREHPAFSGYPDAHPPITSLLGVPIQSGGQTIANLYLANKSDGSSFSEEDQQLTEMMATHAAAIIQNLRYQEQARNLALLQSRERIARQLQDDVLQAIYGVGLLLNHLDLDNPRQAANQISDLHRHLDEAIERLRAHLLDLAPGLDM